MHTERQLSILYVNPIVEGMQYSRHQLIEQEPDANIRAMEIW